MNFNVEPMNFVVFSNRNDYSDYKKLNVDLYDWRMRQEKDLPKGQDNFSVDGECKICGKTTKFHVINEHPCIIENIKYPNYREHLNCPFCGFNSRMRAAIHIIDLLVEPKALIYMTEQVTPLFDFISKKYSNVIGSEYLGDAVEFGCTDLDGIRNESVTNLTFANETFDTILSFDVFEHVSDYMLGFKECYRVLKNSGWLIFSVPFVDSDVTVIRAAITEEGRLQHILEPEYHGDPLSNKGCLCFQHFGWDILDSLKKAGFSKAQVVSYWSKNWGYMGLGEQLIFIAKK